MLVPSLFTDNFVNDFLNGAFDRTPSMFHTSGSSLMSADIKEFKDHYELGLELPGYKKDDVTATLKDGYLTVEESAKRQIIHRKVNRSRDASSAARDMSEL